MSANLFEAAPLPPTTRVHARRFESRLELVLVVPQRDTNIRSDDDDMACFRPPFLVP